MEQIPRIGVGVLILKDSKVLLGKRKNAHGPGSWCPPGGHLEFMETIEDCAKRETLEETGVTITNIRKPAYTEDFFTEENKHYLTFLLTAGWESGQPEILEPEKCEAWEWFDWNKLPSPLFLPLQNHIERGYDPFAT
ncbi:MAG: NUDIX domain-containing protein [Candidatus Kaiserbacteria bacterium]|nr:NUDIX domain-containing protein [Candidatus Kaiserbacteria bacterium]MCB9816570.1 NUDIX domain-containing protein [Candidatus Nomurabacteria bacterium]